MDKYNTFVVSILYTQHSSWQGSIDWISGGEKKTQCFRSALELIRLIDDAVGREDQKGWDGSLPENGTRAQVQAP